jgi:hypothetical protein
VKRRKTLDGDGSPSSVAKRSIQKSLVKDVMVDASLGCIVTNPGSESRCVARTGIKC